MKILIESIDHNHQRYNTCGDWQYFSDFAGQEILSIRVSELKDRREMILVAIHELIEAELCMVARVKPEDVDRFDLAHTQAHEPGDDPEAPYYHQHQIATGIERLLAVEMGVYWLEYEAHLGELSYRDESFENNPIP